jgi:hypothetical protein
MAAYTFVLAFALTACGVRQTGNWASLESQIGKYPMETGLYDDSPVSAALQRLLGNKFETFKTNMKVSGPLLKDRVFYVTGNKPHEGGSEAAYLLIDVDAHRLEVGLWENGRLTIYKDSGEPIFKPKDVVTMIANAEGK